MSSKSDLSFDERLNKIASKNNQDKESWSEYLTRLGSQGTARVAETVIGLPGNIKKGAISSRDQLSEMMGLPNLSELEQQAFRSKDDVVEEKGTLSDLIMDPSSKNLRENVTPKVAELLGLDKDYFEPRSKTEEIGGEFVEDLTSMFLPGTRGLNMWSRIGAPILGNLGKQTLKMFGVSDDKAEKAKMGIMLAATIAGQSNPGRYAGEQIQRSKEMIPQGATVDYTPIGNSFNRLRNDLRGIRTNAKRPVLNAIEDLEILESNGRYSYHDLMRARDDINALLEEAGAWNIPAPVRNRTVRNLNNLKRDLNQNLQTNLNNNFPEAAQLYQDAYQAAAVNHQSNVISNFIEKNFGRKLASASTKLVFPAAAGGAALVPKTSAMGAAFYPAYKTGQVLYRINQSPMLRRYYADVIRHSLEGNAAAMTKSMTLLDKQLKKSDDDQPMTLEEFKESFNP